MVVFGLGFGDLSVTDAMKQGSITKLSKVTLSQNYVLIFGENCLIVEGEGEASNATTGTPRHDADPDSGYGYRQHK